VVERHRLKRQDRFAGSVHRFDFLFEPTSRAVGCAELAGGIDQHLCGVRSDDCVTYVADKAAVVHICTWVSDCNNVTGRSDGVPGENAEGGFVAASSVEPERFIT